MNSQVFKVLLYFSSLLVLTYAGDLSFQNGDYKVTYTVKNKLANEPDARIEFDVVVNKLGYIGLGFTTKNPAVMDGADIVIFGTNATGHGYLTDRHATGQSLPVVDGQQDYHIIHSSETATHTQVKFYRFLNTCDSPNDIEFKAENINIIWSLGATDEIVQHATKGFQLGVNLREGYTGTSRVCDSGSSAVAIQSSAVIFTAVGMLFRLIH